MIEILNIAVSLDALLPENRSQLVDEIARVTKLPKHLLDGFQISRKSVDARKKQNVHFVVSIALPDSPELQRAIKRFKLNARAYEPAKNVSTTDCSHVWQDGNFLPPVVIGAGPAGLFCALYLALAGLKPIVIERGSNVSERKAAIDHFISTRELNPECNIQFGEGGAGTFSDGKLTTGTKGAFNKCILKEFVDAGAPDNILVDAKPHIGTDILPKVIANIRYKIESLGGTFMFDTRVDNIELEEKNDCCSLKSVKITDLQSGAKRTILANIAVLCIGHSARDTYEMLHAKGFAMRPKPFAMGIRIEHMQNDINRAQYGKFAAHEALGAADYKLAIKTRNGRGVYTFCMCPGGEVVAAASEEGRVCVNGMSNNARDGRNANSALLIEVHPDDLEGDGVLAGVRFQRELEQKAYQVGCRTGAAYSAPAQTVGDFLNSCNANKGEVESSCPTRGPVEPTYPLGIATSDLHECLPDFMTDAIEEALPLLENKLDGFADANALMTAVEARSSAPVWIERDKQTREALGVAGVYPAGEGAGYAGGIMSAAVDGLKTAEAICNSLRVTYGAMTA